MPEWKGSKELADALLSAIEKHSLDFKPCVNSFEPISPHESVNILFHGSPALLSEDRKGILTFYSYAAIDVFGYSVDEAIGMPSLNLVPERFREGREQLFNEIINKKVPRRVETFRLHKLGHEIEVYAQVFPYESAPGEYNIAAIVKRKEILLDSV